VELGRKENRTSKGVQTHSVKENRREKWRSDFRRRMMMLEHDRENIDVRGRDLGMEGTRRGNESARKTFERDTRSGQRNARLHSEEECKRNRLRVKVGKRTA
jgi:hypothetical protein